MVSFLDHLSSTSNVKVVLLKVKLKNNSMYNRKIPGGDSEKQTALLMIECMIQVIFCAFVLFELYAKPLFQEEHLN